MKISKYLKSLGFKEESYYGDNTDYVLFVESGSISLDKITVNFLDRANKFLSVKYSTRDHKGNNIEACMLTINSMKKLDFFLKAVMA